MDDIDTTPISMYVQIHIFFVTGLPFIDIEENWVSYKTKSHTHVGVSCHISDCCAFVTCFANT
jgi:hypothetical protein